MDIVMAKTGNEKLAEALREASAVRAGNIVNSSNLKQAHGKYDKHACGSMCGLYLTLRKYKKHKPNPQFR